MGAPSINPNPNTCLALIVDSSKSDTNLIIVQNKKKKIKKKMACILTTLIYTIPPPHLLSGRLSKIKSLAKELIY